MDEGANGVNERAGAGATDAATSRTGSERDQSPESAANPEELEARVDSIRDNLGELVAELDRRRHRAVKPLVIGAIAAVGLTVGGVLLWRRGRKSSRLGD